MAPDGFGGAELAGDDPDGEPAGADDEWDGDVDVVAGFFDVADGFGRGVDVAFADEVAAGTVAMIGALWVLVAPRATGALPLLLLLSVAQPLSPDSATIAIAVMSGLFVKANTP